MKIISKPSTVLVYYCSNCGELEKLKTVTDDKGEYQICAYCGDEFEGYET